MNILRNLTVSVLTLVLLTACSQKQSTQTPATTSENPSIAKTYTNEQFGYEIQYPSYMTVSATRNDDVNIGNLTCVDNDKLCMPGIGGVQIDVTGNDEHISLEQYFDTQKKSCPKTTLLKILPLPETYDEQSYLQAIRCEFAEVPKQAPGGYMYTLLRGNQVYTISFLLGDATPLASIDGRLENIGKMDYDSLGDMMMRTFKFTK